MISSAHFKHLPIDIQVKTLGYCDFPSLQNLKSTHQAAKALLDSPEHFRTNLLSSVHLKMAAPKEISCLLHHPAASAEDVHLLRKAFLQTPGSYKFFKNTPPNKMPPCLKALPKDKNLAQEIALWEDKNSYYRHAPEKIKFNPELAAIAISQVGWNLAYASSALKDDKDLVLKAVRSEGHALFHASKRLRDDATVVLTAVKQWGAALKFASERLRKKRPIVEAAIGQYGKAIGYALGDLKKDRALALMALKKDPNARIRLPKEMRENLSI